MKHTLFTAFLAALGLLLGTSIQAKTTTVTSTKTLNGQHITIKKGDTLMIRANYILEGCTLENNGVIVVSASNRFAVGKASKVYNNGTIYNRGTFIIGTVEGTEQPALDTLFNKGSIVNYNNLRINAQGCLLNEDYFVNGGTVQSVGVYDQSVGAVTRQDGTAACSHKSTDPNKGYCPLCDGLVLNKANFPDAVFLKYVTQNLDKDSKNVVPRSSVEAFEEIEETEGNVRSFEGIKYFTGLKYFYVEGHDVKSVDFSHNNKLVTFSLTHCPNLVEVTGLNSPDLDEFFLYATKVHTLDLSKCPSLAYFEADNNQFDTLDLRKNPEIRNFTIEDNRLSYLNVSKCTKLHTLYVSGNNLTKLDVSNNKELSVFYCRNNKLSALNLKNNTKLNTFACSANQLVSLDLSKNTQLVSVYSSDNVREVDLFPCRFKFSDLFSEIKDSLVSDVKGAKYVKKAGGEFYYIPTDTIITYTYDIKAPAKVKPDVKNSTFTLKSRNVKKHVYDLYGICTYCGYHCDHKRVKDGFCSICEAFTEEVKTFDVTVDVPWMNDSVRGGSFAATINGKYPFSVAGIYDKNNSLEDANVMVRMVYLLSLLSDAPHAVDTLATAYRAPARKDSLYWSTCFRLSGITENTQFNVNGAKADFVLDYDSANCLISFSKTIDPLVVKKISLSLDLPVLGGNVSAQLYDVMINDSIPSTVAGNWTNAVDGESYARLLGVTYLLGKSFGGLPADGSLDSFLLSQTGVSHVSDTISFIIASSKLPYLGECEILINGQPADFVQSDSTTSLMLASLTIMPSLISIDIEGVEELKEYHTYSAKEHDLLINGASTRPAYVAWVKGNEKDALSLAYLNYKEQQILGADDCNSSLLSMENVKYQPKDGISFVMLLECPGFNDTTKVTFNGGKTPSYVHYDSKTNILEVANYYHPTNGVRDANSSIISVAPNPAVDQVMVSTTDGDRISLFDAMGKEVISESLLSGKTVLNVSALPSGTYLLMVYTSNGQVAVSKLIKK